MSSTADTPQVVLKHTPLLSRHIDAGGRMVDFAGWEMPLNYGSQLREHQQVRQHAGLFDVSHMTVIDVAGTGACEYLRFMLTNDVIRLDVPGKALYTGMLNEDGGVMDDLIVYSMEDGYRLVVNCATREKDLEWLRSHTPGFQVQLEEKPELAILAVHGPEAITSVCDILGGSDAEAVAALTNFRAVNLGDFFVARTGYTGEKGVEVILSPEKAAHLWDALIAAGVAPIGLGARDSLRLEAGMNLYGHDMDEQTSPLAANMEQVITWEPHDRDFIGRTAVTAHKSLQAKGKLPVLTGIVMESKGVLREGQAIQTDLGVGVITSGGFSPTLNHAIALARMPVGSTSCEVDIRGRMTRVRIVKPNFVRFGRKVFE